MSSLSRNRQLHTSVRVLQEQQQHSEEVELENFEDDDVVTAFMNSKDTGKIDTTSAGHLAMRRDRQILYYLRLIENELPDLVGMLYFLSAIPLHSLMLMSPSTSEAICTPYISYTPCCTLS